MKLVYSLIFGAALSCSAPGEVLTRVGSDQHKRDKQSFLPENNYDERFDIIGNVGEITEDDFDIIVSSALEIYQPIFNDLGLNLSIFSDWSSSTVNAYCSQTGNNVEVSLFGGLARHKEMTFNGMILVTCHELGHAIAGTTFYPDSDFASSEGMSDYFSTSSCARRMFDKSSPLAYREIWKRKNPDQQDNTNQGCNKKGINKEVCELSLKGGLSLGRVLASLGDEPMPSYEKLDTTKIKKTLYSHPRSACRLAQYYSGAVCQKTWNDSIIPKSLNESQNSQCRELMGCWLNEKNL